MSVFQLFASYTEEAETEREQRQSTYSINEKVDVFIEFVQQSRRHSSMIVMTRTSKRSFTIGENWEDQICRWFIT